MYREGTWVTMESLAEATWAEHAVHRAILFFSSGFASASVTHVPMGGVPVLGVGSVRSHVDH